MPKRVCDKMALLADSFFMSDLENRRFYFQTLPDTPQQPKRLLEVTVGEKIASFILPETCNLEKIKCQFE